MPRAFKLTWQAGTGGRGGRWKKKYKNKPYYFDGGRGKFDREAYEAAVKAWEILKVYLDGAAPRPHQQAHEAAIATWEQVLAWSTRNHDTTMAQTAYESLGRLRRRLEAPVVAPLAADDRFESQFTLPRVPIPDNLLNGDPEQIAEVRLRGPIELNSANRARILAEIDGSPLRIAREVWHDRLETQERRAAAADDSLRAHVEQYLKQCEQRIDAGDLKVGRLYAIRLHLTYFQDWLGRDTAVREIDGNALMRYHTTLLDRVRAKTWSRTTARHYLVTVKSFVRWLWQTEAIPTLPRVMDDKSGMLKIGTPLPVVVVFTQDELTSLLTSASDRTKLYILLMLNCGMTQKDVSDLLDDEVKWTEGRIVRKRSKTSEHESVPTVSYLLWPETLRLLRQERGENRGGRVLLNSNGSPLWTETIAAEGKYKKTDNIKNSFDRLRKEHGIDKPLKSLKKTSATLIRGNERFQGLDGLFLGHAPQSMSDKHYTQVPQNLLDEAIRWLGSQYGVA